MYYVMSINEVKAMIRKLREDDYDFVIVKLNEWWGGRNMADMLPRLFFIHFRNSSFVYEEAGRVIGFLVGFISNTHKNTGYVHFVGVDPECRNHRVATKLYEEFIDYCIGNGVSTIKCVTSPINKVSIAFHHSLGFKASAYDVNGAPLPVKSYDGPDGDRVLLSFQVGK